MRERQREVGPQRVAGQRPEGSRRRMRTHKAHSESSREKRLPRAKADLTQEDKLGGKYNDPGIKGGLKCVQRAGVMKKTECKGRMDRIS